MVTRATYSPPRSVREVLDRLLADDPGRPRVTWYGPDHERVELSAKTLTNWVAKTANLLLDELEVEPGQTVGLDLPPHWRSVVWALSGWAVGAHLVQLAGPGAGLPPVDRVDVLVGTRVTTPPPVGADAFVVVSLPALATRYAGELPVGALDAATEVRLQPDAFPAVPVPDPRSAAFTAGTDAPLTYQSLWTTTPRPGRILQDAGLEAAPAAYLAPLLAGGSLVLHHALADLDEAALAHLSAQEGVTPAS